MRALLLFLFSATAMAQHTIVLQTPDDAGGRRRFQAHRVSAGSIESGEVLERERCVAAAVDGDALWVATATGEASSRLERVGLFAPEDRRAIDLDRVPVSLFAIGDRCWLGGKGWVACADLGAEPPRVDPVHRWEPARKPVDFFLREGSRLIGVDDVAMPFDAHVLDLDGEGRATYRRTVRLPRVINGHYAEGTAGGGRVYFLVPFGVMTGSGHGLASFDLEALDDLGEGPINSGSTRPGWLEEFVSRMDLTERTLLAGSDLTPLSGLGLAGDLLLAGAGERGVLVVTLPLGPDSKGTAIDVGGPCLDLVVRDGTAYALVAHGDAREVAVLARAEGGRWAVTGHAVAGGAARFVR